MISILPVFVTILVTSRAIYTDFKNYEIENWLNWSFIAFGLLYNIYRAIAKHNYNFIWHSFLAASIVFVFAIITTELNLWGGGDAKLIIGYAALYPLMFVNFAMNLFIVGMIYGLIYTIVKKLILKDKYEKGYMPFAPAFLFAFITTLNYGNVFLLFYVKLISIIF